MKNMGLNTPASVSYNYRISLIMNFNLTINIITDQPSRVMTWNIVFIP
jgi:hypothetical protein